MDIEAWFETMPSELVNEIGREKRYIWYAITDEKALRFDKQDYIIKDILTMSRKAKNGRKSGDVAETIKSSPKSGSGNGGKQTRWASADIRTSEHKNAVRELAKNPDFVLDTIVELLDDGYDLHVKRTDAGSTIRSMLFCHADNSPNKGCGLSAEAPDAWLSLTALVYKHSTILDGRWFDEADETDEDDGWR